MNVDTIYLSNCIELLIRFCSTETRFNGQGSLDSGCIIPSKPRLQSERSRII